jgi:polyhydroxyalkanoate synthesis regulator phasin
MSPKRGFEPSPDAIGVSGRKKEAIMLEEMKRGLLTSLGAVLLTKDKIEETVQKMVKESRISESDARKLRDELMEDGEHQFSRLEDSMTRAMEKGLERMGIAREKDLLKIKHRLDALDIRVSVLEKEIRGDAGPKIANPAEGEP